MWSTLVSEQKDGEVDHEQIYPPPPRQIIDAEQEQAMAAWQLFCELSEEAQTEIWAWLMSQG